MSKQHRNSQSPIDLRAVADIKVATWRKLHEEAEQLHAAFMEYAKNNQLPNGTYQTGRLVIPSAIVVEHVKFELTVLEAREKAAIAEHEASAALDAAELAEGLEDARARDLRALHGDLLNLSAEVDRLDAALKAAVHAVNERSANAVRGDASTAARRTVFRSAVRASRRIRIRLSSRAYAMYL